MPDALSPEARSERMSRVRGSDTKPQLWLRKAIHARGFRYALGWMRMSNLRLTVDRTTNFMILTIGGNRLIISEC
ncbi:TPA: hypothetical protein UM046_002880 [Stenotrophomonas maltophilia]|nr:hypothetical protein [Stenotrophomonas maltophilia]